MHSAFTLEVPRESRHAFEGDDTVRLHHINVNAKEMCRVFVQSLPGNEAVPAAVVADAIRPGVTVVSESAIDQGADHGLDLRIVRKEGEHERVLVVSAPGLAWALVDLTSGAMDDRSECFEDRWADALVERLVQTGGIELRGKLKPNGEIAHHLQEADDDGFAEWLLGILVESTAIAEVFVDEQQLEEALRETRPAE